MIKHIEIKNYKSLRDVSVDLDPLTVLIGRSGSGKTNFVSAIRFLRDYLTVRSDQVLRQQEGWGRIFNATADDASMSFRLVFSLGGVKGDFDYEIIFTPQTQGAFSIGQFRSALLSGQLQFLIASETLKVGTTTLFEHKSNQWVVTPHVAQPPPPGHLVLGLIYGIPEVQLAYQFLTRGIGCYDFPSNVLGTRNTGQPKHAARAGFQDDGANYLETFGSIADDLSDLSVFREIIAGVRKLSPSINSIELESRNRSEVLVGHQINDTPVMTLTLSQQSEGMRRFLAQMLALYQVPRKQTLIFEEPEKGMYAGALQVLADYFKAESKTHTQIILTTHNPLLLDHLPVDSVRVVEMHGHSTHIGRLSQGQIEGVKEHLLTPGELLTVDEARTEVARPLAG